MRFLAFTAILLAGPTLVLGIGEFEKRIAAENSLAGKIALAEKAFDTIEGFVPRELFMSYWSIDALSEIAAAYKEVADAEGIESLVDEYSNISRICAMEMGDYRYYFKPLKAEIEALLKKDGTAEGESERSHAEFAWSEGSIKSLIEFWFLSGQAKEGSNIIEALLKANWSESDIAYWDKLISQAALAPSELLDSLKTEVLARRGPLAFANWLVNYGSEDDFRAWVPEISTNQSEVSTGGPRLD